MGAIMSEVLYRSLKIPDECSQLVDLIGQTFALSPSDANSWLDAALWSETRVLVASTGIEAALVRIPMAHYFGATPIATLGLTGVAVRADRRRAGLGGLLLRRTLAEAREQGFAASSLYSQNHTFYRAMGFEHAATRSRVETRLSQIRAPKHPPRAEAGDGSVCLLPRKDAQVIQNLYEAHAHTTPGFLVRTPYHWRRILGERAGVAPSILLSLDASAEPDGYVVFRQRRKGDEFAQEILIEDAVADGARAHARLWQALAGMAPMAESLVYYSSANDPFFLASGDLTPRLASVEPLLLRILDVPRCLESRGYSQELRLQITLAVDDPEMPDNRGPWYFCVENGQARVEKARDLAAPAQIEIDIGALAGLFTGHLSLRSLKVLGRIEGEDAALAALGCAFSGCAPWLRDLF
jgi:predicted acetyltransferase